MNKFFSRLVSNLDTLLAISLSMVAAIFGIFGVYEQALLPAIATTLALVAASIIRDRDARNRLQEEIHKFEITMSEMRQKPNADVFFRRSSFASEQYLAEEAREEIWLIEETGSLILEQPGLMREFIRRGGKVKMLLVSTNVNSVEALVMRNSDVKTIAGMTSRQENAIHRIETLKLDTSEFAGQLHVKRIPYPLDITGVFADPESADVSQRKALIRLVGFRVPFNSKREFSITFLSEPEMFQYFVEQFRQMWDIAE